MNYVLQKRWIIINKIESQMCWGTGLPGPNTYVGINKRGQTSCMVDLLGNE